MKKARKQILFTEKNKAELVDGSYECNDNSVVVKTMFSVISNGTEKANITGDPCVSIYSKETDPVVFPRQSGYSSSGIVIEVGKNVKSVKVGDKVSNIWSKHNQVNVMPENQVIKIDDSVSFKEAALFHISTFPMAALRKVELELGESMLVMGLGILGLFSVQLAKCAGAVPVIAVDPIQERREKALKLGADYAFDPYDKDFVSKVKSVSNGGVNCAIEVTGLGVGLDQCLDCMKKYGRVALLGCTRKSDFSIDYYRKVHGPGITLIGAHTLARPSSESSRHWFTVRDDMETIFKLASTKRLNLEDMIDEIHSPNECSEVYKRLVECKNFPTAVEFDWSLI